MARRTNARTRSALVQAAGDLFYARGFSATALDEVVAAAGTTKPTLYRYFPSKDELVSAYLDRRHEQLEAELREWLEPQAPEDRPAAAIDWLCDWIRRPAFNGCAFLRGLAELPSDPLVLEKARARKDSLRRTLAQACRSAAAPDPTGLAEQLLVIIEGATTTAFISGDADRAADAARRLARAALAAAEVG